MANCLKCGGEDKVKSGTCLRCYLRQFGEARRKYHWTPELILALREAYKFGRVERAAALDKLVARTKWPRRAFWNQAMRLGISFDRRPWTAADDEFLADQMGVMAVSAIARKLGRSVESVQSRAQRLRLSGRVQEGYNISDLVEVLGASDGTVRTWMRRGLLGVVQERAGLRVSEDAVVRFLRRCSGEYDLRRVDQVWFKAMVFRAVAASEGMRTPRGERSVE